MDSNQHYVPSPAGRRVEQGTTFPYDTHKRLETSLMRHAGTLSTDTSCQTLNRPYLG